MPKSSSEDIEDSGLTQAGASNATARRGRTKSENIPKQPHWQGVGSLADAEVAENVIEQIIWGDRSGDAPQLFERFFVVDGE